MLYLYIFLYNISSTVFINRVAGRLLNLNKRTICIKRYHFPPDRAVTRCDNCGMHIHIFVLPESVGVNIC